MEKPEEPIIENKSSRVRNAFISIVIFVVLFTLGAICIYGLIRFFSVDVGKWKEALIAGVGLLGFVGFLALSRKMILFYGPPSRFEDNVPLIVKLIIALMFLAVLFLWKVIDFDPGDYSITRKFFGEDLSSIRRMIDKDEMSRYEFKQMLLRYMTEEEYEESLKNSGLSEREFLDKIANTPVNLNSDK